MTVRTINYVNYSCDIFDGFYDSNLTPVDDVQISDKNYSVYKERVGKHAVNCIRENLNKESHTIGEQTAENI